MLIIRVETVFLCNDISALFYSWLYFCRAFLRQPLVLLIRD